MDLDAPVLKPRRAAPPNQPQNGIVGRSCPFATDRLLAAPQSLAAGAGNPGDLLAGAGGPRLRFVIDLRTLCSCRR